MERLSGLLKNSIRLLTDRLTILQRGSSLWMKHLKLLQDFPHKVELNQMGELEQSYYMAVLEYAHALEASSNAILDAAGDLGNHDTND